MLGPYPRLICDFCGKDCFPEEVVLLHVTQRGTRRQWRVPYDFHSSCATGFLNVLYEYGGVNLINGKTYTLLPGPGAFN